MKNLIKISMFCCIFSGLVQACASSASSCNNSSEGSSASSRAFDIIHEGEVVAFPTEKQLATSNSQSILDMSVSSPTLRIAPFTGRQVVETLASPVVGLAEQAQGVVTGIQKSELVQSGQIVVTVVALKVVETAGTLAKCVGCQSAARACASTAESITQSLQEEIE